MSTASKASTGDGEKIAFSSTEHGAVALSASGSASGSGLSDGKAAPGEMTGDIRASIARRAGALAVLSGSLVGQRIRGRPTSEAVLRQRGALRGAARASGREGKEEESEEIQLGSVQLLPAPELRSAVERVIKDGAALGASALQLALRDLFVLSFEVGDVQEGRGERLLMSQLLLEIGRKCPRTARALLRLVPRYASWRNLRQLHGIAVRAARTAALGRDDAGSGSGSLRGASGSAAALASAGRVDADTAGSYDRVSLVGLAEGAEVEMARALRRDAGRLAAFLRR